MNLKYLKNQGEPEAFPIAEALKGWCWDHYIAIPCCGEDELLPGTLASINRLESSGKILVLLLINEGPQTSSDYKESNQRTLQFLKNQYSGQKICERPDSFLAIGESFDLLYVDRTGENCFPKRKGVGLARKICSDIGLALFQEGILKSQWIHNSDGDARLPIDYLT